VSDAQTTNDLHATPPQGRPAQMTELEPGCFLRQLNDFSIPDEVFPLTPATKVLPVSWPSAGKLSELIQLLGQSKEEDILIRLKAIRCKKNSFLTEEDPIGQYKADAVVTQVKCKTFS